MLKLCLKSLLGFCVVVSVSTIAQASRVVLTDLPGNSYSDRGQIWNGDTQLGTSSTGVVSFDLNFGSGPASQSFTMSALGEVLFSGNNFVAPFLSATPYKVNDVNSGYMSWGRGLVDPTLLDDVLPDPAPGTFDVANALGAFRFTWSNVCHVCDGSDDVTFQLLLVDHKNGNFDLDFNYFAPGLSANGSRGFRLGDNVLATSSGPFPYPGPDFCFSGGALCGTVAAVPEPEVVTMLAGGLALLGVAARRRRAAAKRPH